MKDNSKAVAGMLFKDVILLAVFLLAALGINCFVLLQTLPIVDDAALRTVITVVFTATSLVLAGAMAWVARHLSKNKDEVYGEDLHYQHLIRQQKEGK